MYIIMLLAVAAECRWAKKNSNITLRENTGNFPLAPLLVATKLVDFIHQLSFKLDTCYFFVFFSLIISVCFLKPWAPLKEVKQSPKWERKSPHSVQTCSDADKNSSDLNWIQKKSMKVSFKWMTLTSCKWYNNNGFIYSAQVIHSVKLMLPLLPPVTGPFCFIP